MFWRHFLSDNFTLDQSFHRPDHDASGDGLAFAWKITEMYTTRCPDVCGTMQAIDGYGKFKGVTYSGAWTRTHVFTDGAVGTVKTTYTTK